MHTLKVNTKALNEIDIKELKLELKYKKADAMFNVGMMLHQGIKTKPHAEKGIEWLIKAAMANHTDAAYNLGLIYLCGLGTPVNIKKGRDFIEMAQKNGAEVHALLKRLDDHYRPLRYESAEFDMDLLNEHYNKQVATKLIPKTIDIPLVISFILILFGFYLFITGLGRLNFLKALVGVLFIGVPILFLGWRPHMEKKIPIKNKSNSKIDLKTLNAGFDGQVAALNPDEIEEKAHNKNHEAVYIMGYMYYKGINKPQDYVQAAQWLKKGAMLRNADSSFLLGIMHIKGEGVAQNIKRGIDLIETAAEKNHKEAQALISRILSKYKRTGLTKIENFDYDLLESESEKPVIITILKHPIMVYLIALFIVLSIISVLPASMGFMRTAVVILCIIAMVYITKKIIFKK